MRLCSQRDGGFLRAVDSSLFASGADDFKVYFKQQHLGFFHALISGLLNNCGSLGSVAFYVGI